MKDKILEILEKYNLLIDEGTMQCAITEESFPALTAELSQLIDLRNMLKEFERFQERMKREMKGYSYNTFIDEYLASRPDSKAVTDEMIEKAAIEYEKSIGTVRYIKEAKHDFIQGAKAHRDGLITNK